MNDPIKKFVQEHRDAFDHLEPSAGVLQRLQAQLGQAPVVKQPFFRRHARAAWLVAASLLAGVICTYMLVNTGTAPHREDLPQVAQQPAAQESAITPEDRAQTTGLQAGEAGETAPTDRAERPQMANISRTTPVEQPVAKPRPLASRLADSSSASIRLAAILEIEQSRRMDDRTLAMLSETMNRDGNTNVRLAALDVLSQHLHDPQVADVFTRSLIAQDDPLVQLGLVKVVGQIDNEGIEETLFALVRDPYTFAAVKDEAYAVLLRQNKL